MTVHTQEWALVWVIVALQVLGFWMATRPPGPQRLHLIAAVISFGSAGFLLATMPRLLGWPHGVVTASAPWRSLRSPAHSPLASEPGFRSDSQTEGRVTFSQVRRVAVAR
jgi:hypothetical protein